MKLRVWPILISFTACFIVLFGGYYLYQSYALQSPLNERIAQIEGVNSVDSSLRDDEAVITLELEPEASLRFVVEQIETNGSDYIKNREMTLKITDTSSDAIDNWWSTMLFEVAEAMEKKEYSSIPELLAQHAGRLDGLETFAEMDENNVYVRLNTADAQRFIILPRTPAVYAGWSNE